MDFFTDATFLARLQFAATAAYHFIFVPLTIGLGLILAINETRYYRSRNADDAAATKFWAKIFAATFTVGVATGITMEFSFGTNWADYSRFVGDIFGAPLAAEALLAFFLESVFLGVVLFGRNRVSAKFYLASTWLVWFGSCLSALWILIANSWMQTPAGAELSADGSKAIITDFFGAAFNPTLLVTYAHTLLSILIMGSFLSMAVAAYYLIKKRNTDFAMKTLRTGTMVGIAATLLMIPSAHASAVAVWEEQPTKMAMMEGMYESEVPPLYAFGWVDEENQKVITPFAIPGGTSFLATGTWDTEYQGINDLAKTDQFGDMDPADAPVNFVFQTYHLMVAMFGCIAITVILILFFSSKKNGKIKDMKWLQRLALISPIFPFLAIQAGWFTAEVGRQPWVVYPSNSAPAGVNMLTNQGVSQSVSDVELLVTLVLFLAVYTFLMVAWGRVCARFIKEGPVADEALVAQSSDAPVKEGE